MNRFDIEFWNGSLKSSILIKKEVEKQISFKTLIRFFNIP